MEKKDEVMEEKIQPQEKMAAMKKAGIHVVESPAEIGISMKKALDKGKKKISNKKKAVKKVVKKKVSQTKTTKKKK